MSNLAASNTDRSLQQDIHRELSSLLSPVRKLLTFNNRNPNKQHEILPSTRALAFDQSSSLFLSLTRDAILNCLARVPRQNYLIISHVCKTFRSLVHSPELRQLRLSIAKDYPLFYVCFAEYDKDNNKYFHWYSFDSNEKKTNDANSIRVLSQEKIHYCSSVSIGSNIYFVGGPTHNTSRSLWIFNSLSGELCEGPSMKVGRMSSGVAEVDENLHEEKLYRATVTEAVSIEKKVYGMRYCDGPAIVYDTKHGTYETFEMPNEIALRRWGVCVINNVMYVYYFERGLMWYDSKNKLWRMVQGLDMLINDFNKKSVMVECKGKLGFLWQDRDATNMRIWYAMIVLNRSGVEMHGTIEWSVLVGYVPYSYVMCHGLSVYDF